MNTVLNIYYRLLENAGYWAVLILTFLTVAFIVLAVYLLFTRKSREEQRLEKLLPNGKPTIQRKPKLLEVNENSFVTRFCKTD